MQKNKSLNLYSAALYYRLSDEDIDLTGSKVKQESDSISNQKLLISQYLNNTNENIDVYNSYIDDGYTGTNFERPGFKQLLADIQQGQVNMVIVKDLSRIGRNYVEVGRYVKKIFPQLNVRFISILDRFDSLTATPSDYNILLPVKNFVNENVSRDTSMKIRSSTNAMREAGIDVTSHPPYGYRKSKEEKNKREIDEEAAQVVRNIFRWKLQGCNNQQIVDKLNEMKMPTPAQRKQVYSRYKAAFTKNYIPKWYVTMVIRIMKNKAYIGTLEQGKQRRISYKVRKNVDVPESDWKVCENKYQGIISKSDFNNVQKLLKMDLRVAKKDKSLYLLSGFLYCGDCGKALIRRTIKYKTKTTVYYICASHNDQKGCTRHTVHEKDIQNIVLTAINRHIETIVSLEAVLKEVDTVSIRQEEVIDSSEEIQSKLDEITKYKKLSASLYRDKIEGLISEDEFYEYQNFYDMQAQSLEESVQAVKRDVNELLEQGVMNSEWIKSFKSHRNIRELTRNILIELVDKIVVYEGNRINIMFNYSDQYEALEMAIRSHSDKEVSLWPEQQTDTCSLA